MGTNELAKILNTSHRNLKYLIVKNKSDFEELGELKEKKGESSDCGGRPVVEFLLNKKQILFLSMLCSNINSLKIFKKYIAENIDNLNGHNLFDLLISKQMPKGHIYILEQSEGIIKIGRSIDPLSRFKAIQTQTNKDVKRFFISNPVEEYKNIETSFKVRFKNKCIVGEWFNLTLEKAISFLNSEHSLLGEIHE